MQQEKVTYGITEQDETTSVAPLTSEQAIDFLRQLTEFRAYLRAKYGTFEDSVKVLAMTRERDDDR